jgi:hypothetical protein
MTYLLFILGFGLLYFVSRRKFNRRNIAGIEEYENFEHAIGNSLVNKILKIIAYILIIIGIGNYFNNRKIECSN